MVRSDGELADESVAMMREDVLLDMPATNGRDGTEPGDRAGQRMYIRTR